MGKGHVIFKNCNKKHHKANIYIPNKGNWAKAPKWEGAKPIHQMQRSAIDIPCFLTLYGPI